MERMHGWIAVGLVAVLGLNPAWGAGVAAEDESRVAYRPGATATQEAVHRERAGSARGKELREAALRAGDAYRAAVALIPEIEALDRQLAADRTEVDRLAAARLEVAEREGALCAVERDAWLAARDRLLALQHDANANAAAISRLRDEADRARQSFDQALAALPAVQDADAQLAAARARISQTYLARRKLEVAQAGALAAELGAWKSAEKAYLDFVYAP